MEKLRLRNEVSLPDRLLKKLGAMHVRLAVCILHPSLPRVDFSAREFDVEMTILQIKGNWNEIKRKQGACQEIKEHDDHCWNI
jgi:hypothetical protein